MLISTEPDAVTVEVGAALATHRLTGALGRLTRTEDVCMLALQFAVRLVPSRVASFALPSPTDDELRIVATHGYPLTLVQDARIRAGQGVIGSTYERRKPVFAADVSQFPSGATRRARYRTDSFVALPVMSGDEVMGVICLADRLDGQPFTRRNITALQTLMAPAGLALAGARARQDAEVFAHAATIDPLSGLYNRRYFDARLKEELERAHRQGSEVALLMIDIDNFKAINDTYGHSAGDMIIRGVADVLRRSVRVFEICTRFGGEEFAVVMPGSGTESAVASAERIRQHIETSYWPDPPFEGLRVTVSIGAASSRDTSAQDLVESSDRALYVAKTGGRNRVVAADE